MAGEHELNRDVDIDLGGIFGSIWRNKFKLFVISLIVTLLTFAVLQVISPRYRSEARILIRNSDPVLSATGNATAQGQLNLDDPGIASQVQLLQSRTIARKIIADLALKEKPEFDPRLESSVLSSVFSILGLSDGGRGVTAEDRVLESFYKKLKVFQADRARVIVVQFWSKDPKLAAEIPNRIADEYIALQEELKRGAGPAELEKLEPELKALRASVMKAEAAVAEFRESSDLLQGRDNDTLATQELSEISTELGRVRAQLSQAEANAAAVSRALQSGSLDTASRVLQSTLIQRLRERQVTLNGELAELLTTLLPGHPRVQSLQSQISALNTQISEEAEKIQQSLQEEAEVAREREQDLLQRRNQLKSEAGRVGKAQVTLRSLEREADAQRQLLNSYLVRFKEAKSLQNREFLPADAYVFARAQVQSKAYFPKKVPTLIGAFFGTFVLGSMFTLAGAVLSSGSSRQSQMTYETMRMTEPVISDEEIYAAAADEAERETVEETPPLAPTMESLTQPVTQPETPVGDGVFKTARSLMMLGKARIAVLTPEGEIAAQGASALARSLASMGATVALVDMTGDGASSSIMLGSVEFPGIKDFMAGACDFGDAIHGDMSSSAHIMPVGSADAVLMADGIERLPAIIDALQSTYDYLIVDCGLADIGGLARVSDGSTVNIISAQDSNGSEVRLAIEMMKHAGFRAPLIIEVSDEEKRLMGMAASVA
ncbi:MAG: Wzz/FepE/Etk N-terminal domain-containing protein [Pseudomonadota bacterium]